MGLVGALFGGGTKLELKLDVESVPQGGKLSGHVIVHGGKKPLKITSLNVRLSKLKVEMKEGSSIPDIQADSIVEEVIAKDEALPPGTPKRFDFRLKVPADVEPSKLNISYKVAGSADIPGVADPSADAKIKIVEGQISDDLTLEDILARYPDLESGDEKALKDALHEFQLACYSQRETLLAAEPILIQRFYGGGSSEVKRSAFAAWANLVDNQVRPDHLRLLAEFATQDHDSRMMGEIITAAAKFGEEGTLPMIQQLAQHPDPEIRAKMAGELWSGNMADFPGRREVLNGLATDSEGKVRAAAIQALRFGYREDVELIRWFAAVSAQDPSPEVQAACVAAFSLAHHQGLGDLALQTFERAAQNPNELVRKELAKSMDFQPEAHGPRILKLVERLLADPSDEVRETMAFQICNMEEFPAVIALGQRCAETDPSDEVRAEALQALGRLMPVSDLIPYYERILATNPPPRVWRAVIWGADHQIKEPQARAFLEKLAAQPTDIGEYAQGRLS